MFPTASSSARITPRWLWLTVGLIVVITLLLVAALPPARTDDAVGERGPGVRSQSGVRPAPTPSVARIRTLAV